MYRGRFMRIWSRRTAQRFMILLYEQFGSGERLNIRSHESVRPLIVYFAEKTKILTDLPGYLTGMRANTRIASPVISPSRQIN